jgi:hypothetical protein
MTAAWTQRCCAKEVPIGGMEVPAAALPLCIIRQYVDVGLWRSYDGVGSSAGGEISLPAKAPPQGARPGGQTMSARAAAASVIASLVLMLAACGTPPEVKTLSAAQVSYFDKAIEATRIQSEALIVAAERIKEEAEARIKKREEDQKTDLSTTLAKELPAAPVAQRDEVLQKRMVKTLDVLSDAAQDRANLEQQMAAIQAKTDELQAYIVKMKEVQQALDAYLQSEQAGEKVLHDVLGQQGVSSLLGDVNSLLPKVTAAAGDLKGLIAGLGTPGPAAGNAQGTTP